MLTKVKIRNLKKGSKLKLVQVKVRKLIR